MELFNHNRIQELIDNGYDFDIGRYISEGFDIVKKEFGLFVGFTLVLFLIYTAASFVPFASFIVGAPLLAGFYLTAHKVLKNEIIEFGDFFKGFDYFAQLLIQQLFIMLIMLVVMVPVFLLIFAGVAMTGSSSGQATLGILFFLLMIIVMIGVFYVAISYSFAQHFIIFGNMQAWDAMEASRKIVAKNFFPVLGLGLLAGLINLVGALLCFVGLLFTLPATYAAFYVAFRDIMQFDETEEEDILNHLVD